VFTEGDGKQLTKQFVLAEKKGIRYVIIPGEEPLKAPVTLRDLVSRQNSELTLEQITERLKND